MSSKNSGDADREMSQKLSHIDKWLTSIVGGKAPATPKAKPTKPSKAKTPSRKKTVKSGPSKRPHAKGKPKPRPVFAKGGLRIIPIGGFEEVGKNMMVFEFGRDILIVDIGFQFPTEDMLGIDYVLPDISYLEGKEDRIKGIVLTHGHLDHIGGLGYLLPKLKFPPVYGAPMTIGFVEKQLKEFKITKEANLVTFDPKEKFKMGVFGVSFFRVNHSIPDAVAVILDTPVGRIVHTGDFKFDFTPADQRPADYQDIARACSEREVMVLVSDSTNSLEPGHTTTEKVIAENLDKIISKAKGRLIITSFSSLIGRLQQIMDSAVKNRRKIYLTGRSMLTNIKIAQQLGYIKVPKGILGDARKIPKNTKDDHIMILTTGSQGEDMSALGRMALGTHSSISLKKGDTVVLSSSPIIGNETSVVKVINGLARQGATVVTNREINIHTSGHAKQEDLKLMIKLVKPKHLIPAHGDYYMRLGHKEVAMSVGMPAANVHLLDNGEVVNLDRSGKLAKTGEKVPAEYIMIEGKGDRTMVGAHTLMDRQLMAENGVLVVLMKVDMKKGKLLKKPRIVARGFIYHDCGGDVIDRVKKEVEKALNTHLSTNKGVLKPQDCLVHIQQHLDVVLNRIVDKRPLIVPVFE